MLVRQNNKKNSGKQNFGVEQEDIIANLHDNLILPWESYASA